MTNFYISKGIFPRQLRGKKRRHSRALNSCGKYLPGGIDIAWLMPETAGSNMLGPGLKNHHPLSYLMADVGTYTLMSLGRAMVAAI